MTLTHKKKVRGPAAKKRQKMWCTGGAARSETDDEAQISTARTAVTWTFIWSGRRDSNPATLTLASPPGASLDQGSNDDSPGHTQSE
jgi:hypothetical protein